jgi:glycolate oxidase
MMDARELGRRLREALDSDAVKTAPEDLAAYSFDACGDARLPDAAVLPNDARDVSAIVRIARDCGVPLVARGAGTGLCGGAIPVAGGIVVSFARMNRILSLDIPGRRVRVQAGLVNMDLSRAVAVHGLYFGPDPSSQKSSTLGGNAATNAGGPRAFSCGSMSAHVLGIEFVDATGDIVATSSDDPGYDLTAALVGSEGTLGIVTSLDLRLLRAPRAVRVALAAFDAIETASACVSEIVAAGIGATALEIMDRTIVRAVEAHYAAGYPLEAGAVLLVELAGEPADVEAGERAVAKLAHDHGALAWRSASGARERDALWAARKGAAGAIGRIAPNYYIQDATVPRTRLPQAMRAVEAIGRDCGLPVGNVVHAGDGNLHPLIMFDRRVQRQREAVVAAGHDILAACIELGGTISGEHGIGYEKRETLPLVYSSDDIATMQRLHDAFDPSRLFNPDKIFPRGPVCEEVAVPVAVDASVKA